MIIPHSWWDPDLGKLNSLPKVTQLINCQAKTSTESATKTQNTHLSFLVPLVTLERTQITMGYRSSKVLFKIWAECEYRVEKKMGMSDKRTGLRTSRETRHTWQVQNHELGRRCPLRAPWSLSVHRKPLGGILFLKICICCLVPAPLVFEILQGIVFQEQLVSNVRDVGPLGRDSN